MDCVCHGKPAYWHRDPRVKAGGFWDCSVAERERYERRREVKLQQMRDRYDRDPFFRIEQQLANGRRARARTIKRMEACIGSLQNQG